MLAINVALMLFQCRIVSVVATGEKKRSMCGKRSKILNSLAMMFVFIKIVVVTENPSFDKFLFGDGRFEDNPEDQLHEKDRTKHKSSSIEDLIRLFETEKYLVQTLKNSYSFFDENEVLQEAIQRYLSSVDYDENEENSYYVLHPINSFHLLERLVFIEKWVSEIKQTIPIEIALNSQYINDDFQRAHHGIADLLELVGVHPKQLSDGIIFYEGLGRIYKSNSPLTSSNLMNIAMEAQNVSYVHGYVEWLNMALEKSLQESQKNDHVPLDLIIMINQAKDLHDNLYKRLNDTNMLFMGDFPRINDYPFSDNVPKEIIDGRIESLKTFEESYFNFIPPNFCWESLDLQSRMRFYYRKRIQKLCQNNFLKPAKLEKHLTCFNLHHDNPYLKIGPFKLELKHIEPEIGLFHDFVSINESEDMKNLARGKLRSSPSGGGNKYESFSKARTAKLVYVNEKLAKEAMVISKKIELATGFQLKQDKYGSENFQILNYGIGGKVTPHYDTGGHIYSENSTDASISSENVAFGGERFATFMVYLNSVEVGGNTIFPQAGISIKPEIGSALYWFNRGSQNNYDSRILHHGCPVVYGNKWTANKWVKWMANYKKFPCSITEKYYSIFKHQLSKSQ